MTNESQHRDPVEALAEEFLARRRAGETPSIESYAAAHPDLADEIRDLFPAMMVMERLKPASETAPPSGLASIDLPTTKLGEYNIVREIGRGGMGVVYEAEQESLGRRVAIKLLPNNTLNTDTYVKRFEREARAAAGLHHTNIVPVFGNGKHDDLHFYVMQFIHGCGLDIVLKELKRLRTSGPVGNQPTQPVSIAMSLLSVQQQTNRTPTVSDPTEPIGGSGVESVVLPGQESLGQTSTAGDVYWQSIARIGEQVADALQYAHSQGVLHRDIKPSNLLLDTRGNVWITDFGLAKIVEDDNLTRSGDIVGTMRYMAPERFKGESAAASDTYSLGATLYELLTMQPAFDTADAQKLIAEVTREPPKPLRRINPGIPGDLQTIVMTAMATDPADRYQSAGALAEDLKRFREGRPIVARKAGWLERTTKFIRRKPVISALAAALVVAIIGMAVQWREAVYQADIASEQSDANKLLAEKEQTAKNAEAAARELMRVQLATTRASIGHRAMDDGDYASAMVLLANARDELSQASTGSATQLAAPLNACLTELVERYPSLAHIDSEATATWVSPCGYYLLTRLKSGKHRVTDLRSPDETKEYDHIRLAYQPTESLKDTDWRGWHIRSDGPTEFIDLRTGEPVEPVAPEADALFRKYKGLTILTGSTGWMGVHNSGRFYCLDGKRPMFHTMKQPKVWLLSPNGETLFVAPQSEGKPELWDLTTSKRLLQLDYGKRAAKKTEILKGRFSADGNIVVGRTADKTYAWNTTTGELIATYDVASPAGRSIQACPDGVHFLLADSDHVVRVWNPQTNVVVSESTHPNAVTLTTASPDGLHFATVCDDQHVRIWNMFTGEEVCPPISHPQLPGSVSFSPDGRFLITRADVIRVWDLRCLASSNSWHAHEGGVTAMQVTDDGLRTAGADGMVRTWQPGEHNFMSPSDVVPPMKNSGPVSSMSVSDDGSKVVVRTTVGRVQLWNTYTGQSLSPSLAAPGGKPSASTDTSNDGRMLIVYDDRYNVFDATKQVDSFGNVSQFGRTPRLLAKTRISGDGCVVCSRDTLSLLGVTFIETGSAYQLSSRCRDFTLLPPATLVSNEPDGTIRTWNLSAGDPHPEQPTCENEIRHGTQSARLMLAWSEGTDQRVAVVARNNQVRVLSLATGSARAMPAFRPSFTVRFITAASTSSNELQSALLLADEHEAQLWHSETGLPLTPKFHHTSEITAIGYGHRSIFVATKDGRVHRHILHRSGPQRISLPTPLVELTAGQRVTSAASVSPDIVGTLSRLDPSNYKTHADQFTIDSSRTTRTNWHVSQFGSARSEERTFAANWHIGRLLESDPKNKMALPNAARHALEFGDFDQAVGLLDRALTTQPTADNYLLRGRSHLRLGHENFPAAASDLRKAHELSQDSEALAFFANVIDAYAKSGDVANNPALPAFLQHLPNQLWSKRGRQPSWKALKHYRVVATELEELAKPEVPTKAKSQFVWLQAVCLAAVGKQAEALTKLDGSDHALLRARLAADLGKWELVLETTEEPVRNSSSADPLPHFLRALAQQSLAGKKPTDEQVEAITTACNSAIECNAEYVPALLVRSQLQLQARDFPAAARDLKTVCDKLPNEPAVLQLGTVALANSGELKAAGDLISKAIAVTPQPTFYDLRMQLNAASGNLEAAAVDHHLLMRGLSGAGVQRMRNRKLFGPFLATCAQGNRFDLFENWLDEMDRTYSLNPKENTNLPRSWLALIQQQSPSQDVLDAAPAKLKGGLLYRGGQLKDAEEAFAAIGSPTPTQTIFLSMLRFQANDSAAAARLLASLPKQLPPLDQLLLKEAQVMMKAAK